MQNKTPLDKIIDAAAQRVADFVGFQHDYALGAQSPIERILHAAIIAEFEIGKLDHGHNFETLAEVSSGRRYDAAPDPASRLLFMQAQAPVLKYAADILMSARNVAGQWVELVVECDGHDFHERTKEQAAHDRARDREMQEAGYTVFRFTGSEIYRDPVACARQIIDWIDKRIFA